jgi:replication factor C subunit 1
VCTPCIKNHVADILCERPPAKTEETTSSAYFASNDKARPTRSTPIRAKVNDKKNISSVDITPSKRRAGNTSAPSTGRTSLRNTSAKNYAEIKSDSDDNAPVLNDDQEGHDDIHADDFAGGKRVGQDDYKESEESDGSPLRLKPRTVNGARKKVNSSTKPKLENEDQTSDMAVSGRAPKSQKANLTAPEVASRKRKSKSADLDLDDFLEEDDLPKKKPRKTPTKAAPKKTTKKEEKEESKEMQAIFDSIPTVRAPTPPVRDSNKKFQYGANPNHAPPPGAGSKDIPSGAENCLAGLTFVFTGVLDTLEREQGQNLVRSYGGKVTSGPSSKTSYIVLGNEAGPKKLETIAKLKLKTINEDGLFELIKKLPANGGDSKAAEKHAEKKEKEEKAIRDAAADMERADMEAAKAKAKAKMTMSAKQGGKGIPSASPRLPQSPTVDSRLWTDKYAPSTISMVCGNKGQVEKLQNWLRKWHNNAKYSFKKAGPDGSGVFRAAMIHGPPGIGKTTAAHLVAKLEGFDIVESNASDTRSKKLVEEGLRGVLDTTSLLGYFTGDGKKVEASKRKLVLIMDEVDGMSAGDRGGVGALAAVAKKTSVPMILICNERRLPKMKPFDFVTWDLPFRRPTADMIRARLMTICYREGMKLPAPVLDALIEGSHSDIRQIINMISATKLDKQTLDFSDSKAMSKAWEKHVVLKPWDIVSKILRPQMFAPSSTSTLNEKIELYFNDHEFSHLMLQENYLKTTPSLVTAYSGRERNLKLLELADKAASSISDGDLVDRMIHGTQQQWSLMPTHAVFSFVRPASYMYGNFGERVGFVSWLGQNSKFGWLTLSKYRHHHLLTFL